MATCGGVQFMAIDTDPHKKQPIRAPCGRLRRTTNRKSAPRCWEDEKPSSLFMLQSTRAATPDASD
ncbi:hypothetical protein ZHAS_00013529 [Anopheles sinensis]|uniref:Uncharacterized protein n=1 Tax=Anopheles sinensis TaxID=74873 RepID=A0A084W626_ANOSI|nr:hypothetical protein ZHAS_00013529 [Anopheles sinensis]